MNLNLQYVIDDNGVTTAVLLPIDKWTALLKDYRHLKQYSQLKSGLEDAFEEIDKIEKGVIKPVTLENFLDEY